MNLNKRILKQHIDMHTKTATDIYEMGSDAMSAEYRSAYHSAVVTVNVLQALYESYEES